MDKKQPFWTSLPGILTGCAAIITAIVGIGGLLAALVSHGFVQPPFPTPTQT